MKKGNVLIVGGSRGIGASMVRLFTSVGYSVAFTYAHSAEEASTLSSETGALAIYGDSRRREEINAAIEKFHTALGDVDVLINNAAIAKIGLFTDMTESEWEDMRAVNLDAPMYYAQQIIPEMVAKKKGKIINISSMWGQVGASCEVAYSATKAALIGFTKALAKELGPSGITVNAIAPGVIMTEMNASLGADTLASLAEETPLSRLGSLEDIARAALFLAGEDADFITGQVLAVNGGLVV